MGEINLLCRWHLQVKIKCSFLGFPLNKGALLLFQAKKYIILPEMCERSLTFENIKRKVIYLEYNKFG